MTAVVAVLDGEHQRLGLGQPLARDGAVDAVDDGGAGERRALATDTDEDRGVGAGDLSWQQK